MAFTSTSDPKEFSQIPKCYRSSPNLHELISLSLVVQKLFSRPSVVSQEELL